MNPNTSHTSNFPESREKMAQQCICKFLKESGVIPVLASRAEGIAVVNYKAMLPIKKYHKPETRFCRNFMPVTHCACATIEFWLLAGIHLSTSKGLLFEGVLFRDVVSVDI